MSAQILAVFLGAPTLVAAAPWAVIAAGSNGYWNYRHQADACHAYNVIRAKGVPESNIITMLYDDVANSTQNPFPGKLFNVPDPTGKGKDVYAGCKIDYRNSDVNADTFLGILTGEGKGKVLKSTQDDHVFITFIDHGAPGLVAFYNTELHKAQLQDAFTKMHSKKMFKQLVFYLEACESGSMFEGLNVPGVYAVSAANANESSWGTFCGNDAVVDGKKFNTCLADLFTVNWVQDTDGNDVTKETLSTQFNTVQVQTNKSHVLKFGDMSFESEFMSAFFGSKVTGLRFGIPREPSDFVSAREADLKRLYQYYVDTPASEKRLEAAMIMEEQLRVQFSAEGVYYKLADIAYPGDKKAQHEARTLRHPPKHADCELAGHKAIRESCWDKFSANEGFALQFHQTIVNICHDIVEKGMNLDIRAAAMRACGKEPTVVV